MKIIKVYRNELRLGVITNNDIKQINVFYKQGGDVPESVFKLLGHLQTKYPQSKFITEHSNYQRIIINSALYSSTICKETTELKKREHQKDYDLYIEYIRLLIHTKYLVRLDSYPKRRRVHFPIKPPKIVVKFVEFFKRIINS